ncbi:MAG: uncharacterized protein A8A55_1629 [Amphiamblys sp. WSBS2006]|nr:MAG: uncharacterized protein A8A55_1629 [Amphiamblys sp. WSBS2006]
MDPRRQRRNKDYDKIVYNEHPEDTQRERERRSENTDKRDSSKTSTRGHGGYLSNGYPSQYTAGEETRRNNPDMSFDMASIPPPPSLYGIPPMMPHTALPQMPPNYPGARQHTNQPDFVSPPPNTHRPFPGERQHTNQPVVYPNMPGFFPPSPHMQQPFPGMPFMFPGGHPGAVPFMVPGESAPYVPGETAPHSLPNPFPMFPVFWPGQQQESGRGEEETAPHSTHEARERRPEEKKTHDEKACRVLFVRNAAYNLTEKDVRESFSPFGEIDEISMRLIIKGLFFVTYYDLRDVVRAKNSLHGESICGRRMDIHYSRGKTSSERGRCDETKKQGTLYVRVENEKGVESLETIRKLAGVYGELKDARKQRGKENRFFVEFFDTRACIRCFNGLENSDIETGRLHLEYSWDYSERVEKIGEERRGHEVRREGVPERRRYGDREEGRPKRSFSGTSEERRKTEIGHKRPGDGSGDEQKEECEIDRRMWDADNSEGTEDGEERPAKEDGEFLDRIEEASKDPQIIDHMESILELFDAEDI